MSQFLADAAHKLHTPLTALRTNIELLHEAHPADVAVARALTQIERLTVLTDDLPDLSRIENNAPSPTPGIAI
ncbi:MAG: histidine kinase dimerization/phospho-acceptor domain-containing protein [Chloroflexota bacterium]